MSQRFEKELLERKSILDGNQSTAADSSLIGSNSHSRIKNKKNHMINGSYSKACLNLVS